MENIARNNAHDVASSRRTTVSTDDDALVELDGHDGGLWTVYISDTCGE